jgi:hypothetical protein
VVKLNRDTIIQALNPFPAFRAFARGRSREWGPTFRWRIVDTAAESGRRTSYRCNANAASIDALTPACPATAHRITRDASVIDLRAHPAKMIRRQVSLSLLLDQRKIMKARAPSIKGMPPYITKRFHSPSFRKIFGSALVGREDWGIKDSCERECPVWLCEYCDKVIASCLVDE